MPASSKKRRHGPKDDDPDGEESENEEVQATQSTSASVPALASSLPSTVHVPLVVVPSILNRTFQTWGKFFTFLKTFERQHLVVYRTRDCQSTELFNKSRVNHPERQVPHRFEYAFRKYICTLGCKQKSRSTGKRVKRTERFRDCKADFRVAVVCDGVDDDGHPVWTIKVTKEEQGHNHVTNEYIYTALRNSNDLVSGTVLAMLDAFGETNTETKQITSYVANSIGLPISSQQVRNLINRRLGNSQAEERLKVVLAEFVAGEGNRCLLLQGDYGQTMGIGLQSQAQREIFRQWGDTLCLDWTHNCTNIGFYVGSLVATLPTGRGVSVLDFLCLNQQKETLLAVLTWFKQQNQSWSGVMSLVIDKDFTEWSTLLDAFPQAVFHVLRYVQRMINARKFSVPTPLRDQIETMFSDLMHVPSKEQFMSRLRAFELVVEKNAPAFAKYFAANWTSCSNMWANYGRRRCFSGGNTTTNRVEAGWNQLKQFLGKKNSIDRCVRVILQHQLSVLRELLRSTSLFSVCPPFVEPLPAALRKVCAELSPYTLSKVRQQWESYKLVGSKWSWSHDNYDGQAIYEMAAAEGSRIRVTWAANGEISCDCLFFASTRLLCKHLCSVLVTQRGETAFEVAQLRARWSMGGARSAMPLVDSTVKHLQKFSRITGSVNRTTKPDILLSLEKKIVYVKLKKSERDARTVVSECEKYNVVRAELMPLVDIMQQMPSHQFYDVFSDLRATVEAFKEKWNLNHTGRTDADDLDDDGDDEEFEDAMRDLSELQERTTANNGKENAGRRVSRELEEDAVGVQRTEVVVRDPHGPEDKNISKVAQLPVEVDIAMPVRALEAPNSPPAWLNDDLSACCTSNPSQVSLPALHFSEASQDLIARTDTRTGKSTEELLEETQRLLTRADTVVDRLDVLKLPAASTARAKTTSRIKRAIVEGQSDCPVTLSEFVSWMATTPNLSSVGTIASKYPVCYHQHFLLARIPTVLQKRMDMVCNDANFVIPWKLVERVNSALLHWMEQQSYEENVDPDTDEVIPAAYVASEMGGFSMRFVRLLLDYYALAKDIDEYKLDLAWVQQDWSAVISMQLPFLDKITDAPDVLATKVAQLFIESPFSRKCSLSSGLGGHVASSFRQMIGKLARQKQLNDAVMGLALLHVTNYKSGCYVIDSLSVADEKMHVPDQQLSSCKFVLVPVHMKALKHWMIQIVEIQMSDTDPSKHKIWATFYDPLGLASNLEICQAKWLTFTLPMLQKWFSRDTESNKLLSLTPGCIKTSRINTKVPIMSTKQDPMLSKKLPEFPSVVAVMMTSPKQTDAVSCGVLCIAQAYSYISGVRSLKAYKTISEDDLAQMRLRLLWTLLNDSNLCDDDKDNTSGEKLDIMKRVAKAFRSE